MIRARILVSPVLRQRYFRTRPLRKIALTVRAGARWKDGREYLLPRRNGESGISSRRMHGLTAVKVCIRMHAAHESGWGESAKSVLG